MTIEKDGFVFKYDVNGNVIYAKNPNHIEMWFDETEKLIKARWKNGYGQQYDNGKLIKFGYV